MTLIFKMRDLAADVSLAQAKWTFENEMAMDATAGVREWVANLRSADSDSISEDMSDEDLAALWDVKDVEEDLVELD